MNSIADMGGMDGHGLVIAEVNEPVFHEDWERHTIAVQLAMAMGGAWIADECRSSMERMNPAQYLSSSYYEHWLHFIEELMLTKKLVTKEELKVGHLVTSDKGSNFTTRIEPDSAKRLFRAGGSIAMPTDRQARFTKGQKVIARNIHPITHTRLPRYVRGRTGTVLRNLGSFAFPDTRAHGLGDDPQQVYAVRFDGIELWGPQGGTNDAVILDMYDAYLDPMS